MPPWGKCAFEIGRGRALLSKKNSFRFFPPQTNSSFTHTQRECALAPSSSLICVHVLERDTRRRLQIGGRDFASRACLQVAIQNNERKNLYFQHSHVCTYFSLSLSRALHKSSPTSLAGWNASNEVALCIFIRPAPVRVCDSNRSGACGIFNI